MSVGGQKKRLKDHIKSILKNATFPLTGWISTCALGMSCFDAEYDRAAALKKI